MKKILILLPLFAGGLASCSNGHAEFKKRFVESCEQSAKSRITDNRLVPLLHDYCECSADQLLKKMSEDELEAIKNPDSNPEVREKVLSITAPCLQELQQKSAKLVQ